AWGSRKIGGSEDPFDPIAYLIRQLQNNNAEISSALSFRRDVLNKEDETFCRPFLEAGVLSNHPVSLAASILLAAQEMTQSRKRFERSRALEPYKATDAMIASNPEVPTAAGKRNEMVSISGLRQIDRSGGFTICGGHPSEAAGDFKLVSALDPEI